MGNALSSATRPPNSSPASAIVTLYPRTPRARAASKPAGPAPTINTLSLSPFGCMRSGCQPLRHSSMKAGFCVQREIDIVMSPVTQILQPIHSRMSSKRPSLILFGRKGSAMDGRAAPMKSSVPDFICLTMASGEVNRPTPTIGLSVRVLMPSTRLCWAASSLKRDVPEQSSQLPCARSQRSGRSRCISIHSRNSALVKLCSSIASSSERRRVTPIVSPTASLMSSTTSFMKRLRFSRLPPYSSVR